MTVKAEKVSKEQGLSGNGLMRPRLSLQMLRGRRQTGTTWGPCAPPSKALELLPASLPFLGGILSTLCLSLQTELSSSFKSSFAVSQLPDTSAPASVFKICLDSSHCSLWPAGPGQEEAVGVHCVEEGVAGNIICLLRVNCDCY